jgi:hypothetical protein
VEPLADLIGEEITPEPMAVGIPTVRVLGSPIPKKGTEHPPAAYEIGVFNFLLAHKELLGISEVSKFTSLRVDGRVELTDGRRLAVEIKYRMNGQKSCQAGWQFSWFLKQSEAKARPVSGGLVFFEEFSADWARKLPSRLLENGWTRWYSDHCEVEGLRLDLVRLRNGIYESFPAALAAARASSTAVQPV